MKLYISHSATGANLAARGEPIPAQEWFIVEPRDDPEMLARQVESLRDPRGRGRTVIEIELVDQLSDEPPRHVVLKVL